MTMVYASGEEPRVGDVVCSLIGALPDRVMTVEKVGDGQIRTSTARLDARSLSLIARANQPVKLKPGDVVEWLKGGAGGSTKNVGERDTVVRLDEDGDPILEGDIDQGCGWGQSEHHRFRLVRRPLAGAAPAPTTIRLQDLKLGDRARFTIEATVEDGSELLVNGWVFSHKEMANATIELLERAAPPRDPVAVFRDAVKATEGDPYGGKVMVSLDDARALLERLA